MRFIREFERTPTEALVTLYGAIHSLEMRSSIDEEQLIDISEVVAKRIEMRLNKAEKNPSGDDSSKSDIEDAKALVVDVRADIRREAEQQV